MFKCGYCARTFKKGAVKKTIRGERHIFCCEYCYVLYHYKIPMVDMGRADAHLGVVVSLPDFRELIANS